MSRYLLLLLSLSLLVACPSGDDDDSGTSDDDDAAGIDPEEGTWSLVLGELLEDSCNGFPSAGQGDSLGTSTLGAPIEAGTNFSMVDSDDQTFHCTYTSQPNFTCVADPLVTLQSAIPAATVTRNGTRAGVFTSATEATLSTNRNEDTCMGAECDVVEAAGNAQGPIQFPCIVSFSATASK
jgi:hypothetical protein